MHHWPFRQQMLRKQTPQPKEHACFFKLKMHQNATCFETVWTHENIPSQWVGYEAFEKG